MKAQILDLSNKHYRAVVTVLRIIGSCVPRIKIKYDDSNSPNRG